MFFPSALCRRNACERYRGWHWKTAAESKFVPPLAILVHHWGCSESGSKGCKISISIYTSAPSTSISEFEADHTFWTTHAFLISLGLVCLSVRFLDHSGISMPICTHFWPVYRCKHFAQLKIMGLQAAAHVLESLWHMAISYNFRRTLLAGRPWPRSCAQQWVLAAFIFFSCICGFSFICSRQWEEWA